MGRLRAILLALVISLAAATALSACGGSDKADLLPGETASEINANLDLIEQLVEEGDCVGADNAAASVGEQVEALTGVDKELQEALSEGAARLNEVIVECDEAPEEDEETTLDPELEEEDQQFEEDEKAQQKAEKEEEKEAEKEEKKEPKEEKEAPPVEPPGQEKEEETEPPTEQSDGGTSSGGVSPSTPAGAE
jgi:hypothetical protein